MRWCCFTKLDVSLWSVQGVLFLVWDRTSPIPHPHLASSSQIIRKLFLAVIVTAQMLQLTRSIHPIPRVGDLSAYRIVIRVEIPFYTRTCQHTHTHILLPSVPSPNPPLPNNSKKTHKPVSNAQDHSPDSIPSPPPVSHQYLFPSKLSSNSHPLQRPDPAHEKGKRGAATYGEASFILLE